MPKVDIRCPIGPKRLLSKLHLEGGERVYTKDNFIEFACADCRKRYRLEGQNIVQVLHRYNFLGQLVETEIVPADE